ncbi:MAG: ATP-binding protein [Candidatus Rokuibacteriota bacterium]
MPATPAAPATARRAISSLAPHLDVRVVEDAELLVSELVTNSLRHGGLAPTQGIEVCLRASPQTVMVEVADRGRGFGGLRPRPLPVEETKARAAAPEKDGPNWGLFLVDQLAWRWGIAEQGDVRVWFELRPGTHRPRAAASFSARFETAESG